MDLRHPDIADASDHCCHATIDNRGEDGLETSVKGELDTVCIYEQANTFLMGNLEKVPGIFYMIF